MAAVVRFHAIGGPSYWIDEFYSLQTSNGLAVAELVAERGRLREPDRLITQLGARRPVSQVFEALASDNHPPLYFLALRPWRELFGDGEGANRSLSAVASLAALAVWWWAVRTRHGPAAGVAVAALLAVAGPQIRSAQQLRGYSLAMLAIAVAVLAVTRLEAGAAPRRWGTTLGAAAFAALMTHYYAAGALAGLGAHVLFGWRGPERRAALAALGGGLLAFLVAWGPMLALQRGAVLGNNQWVMEDAEGHATRSLARLAALPATVLVDASGRRPQSLAVGLAGWATLLALGLIRPGARLYLSVFGGAVALVAAVDLALGSGQLATSRYTSFGTAAAAAALACAGSAAWRLVPSGALAVALAGLPGAYAPLGSPWREFARVVDGVARPHEPVLVVASPSANGTWVYQALRHYAWAPARACVFLVGTPRRALVEAVQARGGAWALSFDPEGFESPIPGMSVAERIEWAPELPTLFRLQRAPEPAS